jgi:hypothetical protein
MFRKTQKHHLYEISSEQTTQPLQEIKRGSKGGILHLPTWFLGNSTILAAIHPNRKLECEAPKVIADRSKWLAACDQSVHLLPIATTVALLVLNLLQIYIWDAGENQNFKLNSLQFAAKLHEVLMAASLSSIVLHCIQFELLHGNGVPFGGLLAGFQLTNLDSLWSPGLWATIFVGTANARRALLAVLIVTLVTLTAIVGPASAILMLPSLDWWEFQLYCDEYYYSNNDIRIFIDANESTLWPANINLENYYSLDCGWDNGTVPIYCPLGTFSTLVDSVSPELLDGSMWWNITVTVETESGEYTQMLEASMSFGNFVGEDSILTLTQMAPLAADRLLAYVESIFTYPDNAPRYSLSLKNENLVPAPSTYALCSKQLYSWQNGMLAGVGGSIANVSGSPELVFPLLGGRNWSVPFSRLSDVWDNSSKSTTVWVESPVSETDSPSIGVVYGVFKNGLFNLTTYYNASVTCCSVVSSWEPIELYVTPDSLFRSPTIDNIISSARNQSYLASFEAIKFDIAWAESPIPANETLGALIAKLSNGVLYDQDIPMAVSAFVNNVLSGLGANLTYVFTGNNIARYNVAAFNGFANLVTIDTNDNNTSNWTEFKAALLRNGYSYSIRGFTRRLAASILSAYLMIVVIYMITAISSGWRCLGLQSLIEIIALAMNSTPTKTLGNTSAGISRFNTYKHIVKVRTVFSQHLEMVFDGDMKGNEADDGEVYG